MLHLGMAGRPAGTMLGRQWGIVKAAEAQELPGTMSMQPCFELIAAHVQHIHMVTKDTAIRQYC